MGIFIPQPPLAAKTAISTVALGIVALAWFFSLAYTVFDKVFPAVLPEQLVTAFSLIFLALVLIFCWQNFSRKRVI
jgi:hypothetical protein